MIANADLKRYNKKSPYSYTLGMFPTFELLHKAPQTVEKVLLHSELTREIRDKVYKSCQEKNIEVIENNRIIEKIREKENCFLIGVFRKYTNELEHDLHHVVLVNPSDSGNLGTIIRTCVGFGIHNLAITQPGADLFNPKTIRASMGSVFHLNFHYYNSFEEYRQEFGEERDLYPFMLKGTAELGSIKPRLLPFSLIFGNEAMGLDDRFLEIGQSVLIPHSREIDSLNLSLAAGIAIYDFTHKYSLLGSSISTVKGEAS